MMTGKTQLEAGLDGARAGGSTPSPTKPSSVSTGQPWWRHPMVWLVISGPALVVVAGFWTLWLAISHPDPIVADSPTRAEAGADAETLAQTARNHAATSRARP